MTPVSGFERASLPAWAHVGVVPEVPADPHNRFEHLLRQVTKAAEELDHHHAWQALVPKWAELYDWVLTHEAELEKDRHQAWVKLRETIEERFERWLTKRFSTLINLSYDPRPVMLHHVPHYLASCQGDRRTALVVLDGMSWVNWVQIRRHLSDIRKEWSFAEQAVFCSGSHSDQYLTASVVCRGIATFFQRIVADDEGRTEAVAAFLGESRLATRGDRVSEGFG